MGEHRDYRKGLQRCQSWRAAHSVEIEAKQVSTSKTFPDGFWLAVAGCSLVFSVINAVAADGPAGWWWVALAGAAAALFVIGCRSMLRGRRGRPPVNNRANF